MRLTPLNTAAINSPACIPMQQRWLGDFFSTINANQCKNHAAQMAIANEMEHNNKWKTTRGEMAINFIASNAISADIIVQHSMRNAVADDFRR